MGSEGTPARRVCVGSNTGLEPSLEPDFWRGTSVLSKLNPPHCYEVRVTQI